MEHKAWLWRKKISEKTIVAKDKADLFLTEKEGEREVHLESLVRELNEKLASVLRECNAKDDMVEIHAKAAEEAIAGREKAKAEAVFLKRELDEALLQKVSADETITNLNSALKEYMQQLNSVREDHENTSREFEVEYKKLEEKFTETSKRLANLMVENSHITNALLLKENVIEDLNRCKSRADEEFNMLIVKLDSIVKENDFLQYEFRMLEKELEIRNEEMEFNRRSADASHKQHLESMKKVEKLEAEYQRLRVQVRKRLPGPGALAKMRSEVGTNGGNYTDRRRNMNPMENSSESWVKNGFLKERLSIVEEENKILKEFLTQRDDELRSSRTSFARTASQLSLVEAQLEDLLKVSKDVCGCKMIGFPGEIVCSESWASNIVSETEHAKAKNPSECKMIGDSDMSLMDDFVEMEKLAIVAVDSPSGNSHLDVTGKELVLVESQLPNDKIERLMNQLRESEERIESLETEMETLKESKRKMEDQIEHHNLMNEDLDTQLTVSKLKLNELLKKLSSLEVELEDRSHCCEELEAACLELGLQLESVTKKELAKENIDREKKRLQTDWEISAASVKLAECQETIFNLGKQLKALGSRKEGATEFDKVVSYSKLNQQRSSLRDHLIAENGAESEPENLESPKTKEIISTAEMKTPSTISTVAIVPSNKRERGSSLLKKLLLRRKRGSRRKLSFSLST